MPAEPLEPDELEAAVAYAVDVLRILGELDELEPRTDLAAQYVAALKAKARPEPERYERAGRWRSGEGDYPAADEVYDLRGGAMTPYEWGPDD